MVICLRNGTGILVNTVRKDTKIMNDIFEINHSADLIKSLTLGELAEAYECRIEKLSDLEMLFRMIKYDWEHDCYEFLMKCREQGELC